MANRIDSGGPCTSQCNPDGRVHVGHWLRIGPWSSSYFWKNGDTTVVSVTTSSLITLSVPSILNLVLTETVTKLLRTVQTNIKR